MQEVSQQLTESQGHLKQEKKRVEALQRQLKKVQDEKAEAAARSSGQDKAIEAQLARIRLLERVVEERAASGQESEAALIHAKHASDNKVCPVLHIKALDIVGTPAVFTNQHNGCMCLKDWPSSEH